MSLAQPLRLLRSDGMARPRQDDAGHFVLDPVAGKGKQGTPSHHRAVSQGSGLPGAGSYPVQILNTRELGTRIPKILAADRRTDILWLAKRAFRPSGRVPRDGRQQRARGAVDDV